MIEEKTLKKSPYSENKSIFSSFLPGKPKKYSFGEATHLVLTGSSAGSLAKNFNYQINNKSAHIIGPIHSHDNINSNLSIILLHIKNKNRIFSENPKKMLQIYLEVQKQIKKHGYMNALLIALKESSVPHDPEMILENSKLPNYFLQTLRKI